MSNVSAWSSAAAGNNAAAPDGWPEGMAPSAVNDAGREVMASVRRWYEDAVWTDLGHVPTYTTSITFTIGSDVTGLYTGNRRIRAYGGTMGTVYGSVVSSTYGAPNTTITVRNDSGALDNTLSQVSLSIIDTNKPIPPTFTISNYAGSTGSVTNSYVLSLAVALGAISAGARVSFKATLGNDGSATATLTVNGLPVANLKDPNGNLLQRDSIKAGRTYEAVYSGTEWRLISADTFKAWAYNHGIKTGTYTLDMGLAEIHTVEYSATGVLSVTSTYALDRALVIIKNNNFPVVLAGIDNDSPTLTQSASRQDYIALVKSFGRIGAVSYVLNKTTS